MAQVIEFYVPDSFLRDRKIKSIPQEFRGKIIEFPGPGKKSA